MRKLAEGVGLKKKSVLSQFLSTSNIVVENVEMITPSTRHGRHLKGPLAGGSECARP